jgi:hypothetical protein
VIGVPVALVMLARRGVPPGALAAAGLAVLIALAVGGRSVQEDYIDHRYSAGAPDYPREGEQPSTELGQGLGAAYDWARDVEGERIGLSGTTGAFFQYGLWGLDSSNEVRYLGDRGDKGAFFEITECTPFIEAINEGDFAYVVTTPTYDQDNPDAATLPIQRTWIERSPGVEHLSSTSLTDVWRITGPLDPVACVGTIGAPES